jgi:hypothetical protein
MSEETTEQKVPTREQMIQWYKDEIELATLRAELATLQRDAAVAEAERVQAITVIAQLTQGPEDKEGKPRTLKREVANAD